MEFYDLVSSIDNIFPNRKPYNALDERYQLYDLNHLDHKMYVYFDEYYEYMGSLNPICNVVVFGDVNQIRLHSYDSDYECRTINEIVLYGKFNSNVDHSINIKNMLIITDYDKVDTIGITRSDAE